MKNRKTAWSNRKVYVYDSATGKRDILYPGMIDKNTDHVITEDDIRMLHASDDAEVYNNRKNSKPKVQPWEEAGIEAWKEEHPDEDVPCRDVLSLDNLLDDEAGGDSTEDKGGVIGRASMISYEGEEVRNAQVERMREVVMEMGENYWRLYDLHTIKGYTFEEVASIVGSSRSTEHERYKKIMEAIKSKMYVNS